MKSEDMIYIFFLGYAMGMSSVLMIAHIIERFDRKKEYRESIEERIKKLENKL